MQLIAADIGNSSTKIAVEHTGDGDRWCMETIIRGDDPFCLDLSAFELDDEPAYWVASSVNHERQKRLEDWINKHRPDDQFHPIEADEVDLQSNVESRKQLGRDRLIAAWMAVELNDRAGPLIVVDAGTAVTIDLIDRDLVFQGGFIFAGIDSNFRQLANGTSALPDLSGQYQSGPLEKLSLGSLGKSTTSAIRQGVYHSQVKAIRGIVRGLAKSLVSKNGKNHTTSVYATGGGLQEISNCLPEQWNHVPDLVLQGARSIGRKLLRELTE
jgi:type III pantothenate kinase